ncbi:MAG: glycosyltransferase, partial [Bacteroidales bacterium]|nr:glycosyltransferase [Bacteroidales bacterium]
MAINVFHIVSDKEWAGAEQYVYDLASELRKNGVYIEIVTRNRRQILDRFRDLEVPISILPLKGITDIDSVLRFARLIKRGKNIVHVHNPKDAAIAML